MGSGTHLLALILVSSVFDGIQSQLECGEGWISLGEDKCYMIFHGEAKRTYARAAAVCHSYGSQLAIIKDQWENDMLGAQVDAIAGVGQEYYIGLSEESTDCTSCPELKWSDGRLADEHEGFWGDSHPNSDAGGCVYSQKNPNEPDYVYDRPYVWFYGNCQTKRSFVCMRMAAPSDSFHCLQGGYVSNNKVCDGNNDCSDASDELNCPSQCKFRHIGSSGPLSSFTYENAKTCTWAIETPLGSNAYIELNNFRTEYATDYAIIYVGSLDQTRAQRVAKLSGNQGTKQYRSYNNLMMIVFTTDAQVTDLGFTGTYGSEVVTYNGHMVELTAYDNPESYAIDRFQLGGFYNFLGQHDYITVIKANDTYQVGQMITVQIDALSLHDTDSVMVFDGDSPSAPLLVTLCNSCDNYNIIYSTGNYISLLLRTGQEMSKTTNFRIQYRQGCIFETEAEWGSLSTPGYVGGINYPNYVTCVWNINADEPIAIKFSDDTQLIDEGHSRVNNGDYLELYDNGVAMHSATRGFNTAELRGTTFTLTSGTARLRLRSSPTRSARGFSATWSIGCEDPAYDANTVVSTTQTVYHYTSTMSLTCAIGYAFHQEQISNENGPVQVECGFGGKWLTYLEIPRCTPRYCGDVPNIANGYIETSTGSTFDDTVTYQCFSGSNLLGQSTISCLSTGVWDNPPSCVADSCPGNIQTFIQNGNGVLDFGTGTAIGTIYRFECNDGFEIVGSPTLFCQADGTWSPANEPTCQRKTCQLQPITNGMYAGGNNEGDFINFEQVVGVSCMGGYELENPIINSVTCHANRTSDPIPVCGDIDECDGSNPCNNGGICHNNIGSFTCTCPDGYYLLNDGTTCQDIHECNLNTDNCDQDCVNDIGGYTCSCTRPYLLYGADGTSGLNIPAGETGLLPTNTYHINHTCVLVACPAPPTVPNGVLLTQRDNHMFGDYIEYQCNLGYAPQRSIHYCDSNGMWIGGLPNICSVETCDQDIVNGLENEALYPIGPYSYGEGIYLNCSQAGGAITFQRRRFCTYNTVTDSYELQGSPYECGEIDCGQPFIWPGTTYQTVANTKFGGQFEFTCSLTRQGTSNQGDNFVRCQENGYWDFGDLQCHGLSCTDPGVPAGGSFQADSFSDQSVVTYSCPRLGYGIQGATSITCQGNNFDTATPTCIDTESPELTGCRSAITIPLYTLLKPELPNIVYTDNTGIVQRTISPSHVNGSYYVDGPLTVSFTAVDFQGNTDSCTLDVNIYDETPPTIQCPPIEIIELSLDTDVVTYEPNANMFVLSDNSGTVPAIDLPTLSQTTFGASDLYKTWTYTASARDNNGNVATCKAQIHVRPSRCSELSFPRPLNAADRTCTQTSNGRSCTVTCDPEYTFTDGKTKTFNCNNNNGVWSPEWIPACVRDVTRPVLTCPPPLTRIFSTSETQIDFDFSIYESQASYSDLNDISSVDFTPATASLTTAQLYQAQSVTMTVTDTANNIASCVFQYMVVPPPCSELSYPSVADGSKSCVANNVNGIDCTITCNSGYLIRGIGRETTVSCTNNNAWSDNDIITGCIVDNTPPTLICPASRTVQLQDGDDSTILDFGDGTWNPVVSDTGGVAATSYSQPGVTLTASHLYQTLGPYTITAQDLRGNVATCNFYVSVIAETCSPFNLPTVSNANKNCVADANGYTCTFTCNSGFEFIDGGSTVMSTTCNRNINNGNFNQLIRGCTNSADTAAKQFVGSLYFQYLPNDGTTNVPSSCGDYYQTAVAANIATTETKVSDLCVITYDLDALTLDFDAARTSSRVETSAGNNNNLVTLTFFYIMYSPDSNDYQTCNNAITTNIDSIPFTLKNDIAGDGNGCPPLSLSTLSNPVGVLTGEETCNTPYYEAATNCLKCPAGTSSDGSICTVCPIGTYRTGGSPTPTCADCPTGQTTRMAGSTSLSECINVCANGLVSTTGYSPCRKCAIGTYWINSQTCQSCPSGETTLNEGTTSLAGCSGTFVNAEACPVGTSSDGSGNCNLCAIGSYRPASQSQASCISCVATSTYYKGAISSNECSTSCSSQRGYISADGLAPCTACPKGQYYVNSTHCEACASGYTTISTGATFASACILITSLRVNCPRGTERDINGNCVNCPIGSYSTGEESACQSCSTAYSTYFAGATASSMCFSQCDPGFFSSTGLSPCSKCGVNNFSNTYGSSTCIACGAGNITATDTSSDVSQCLSQCAPGTYSYNGYDMNNACRACPPDHYQDTTGSTACQTCPSTMTTNNINGRTAVTQCQDLNCDFYCQNGGVCTKANNQRVCQCVQGYYGDRCEDQVNYCSSQPCYNGGFCTYDSTGFSCDCSGIQATGARCEIITNNCDLSANTPTCSHGGHCYSTASGAFCLCPSGYGGRYCDDTTDICVSDPCDATGSSACTDVSKDLDLRRVCTCRPGYTGVDCADMIQHCDSTPCINGGACNNLLGGFSCACATGYYGTYCQLRVDTCNGKGCGSDSNAVCIDMYRDNEPYCSCTEGYAQGTYIQYSVVLGIAPDNVNSLTGDSLTVDECRESCTNQGNNCNRFTYHPSSSTCYTFSPLQAPTFVPLNGYNTYEKVTTYPEDDFWTLRYDINTPTANTPQDREVIADLNALGLNICGGTTPLDVRCCAVGDTCLNNDDVPTGVCNLGQSGVITTNDQTDYDVQYKCSSNQLFLDGTCTVKTDYCDTNMCVDANTMTCTNLFDGYRCNCMAGYAGKHCQTDVDNCVGSPCANGGECVDGINTFSCNCATGYTGSNCNSFVNYCIGVNCNDGYCDNIPTIGYTCVCNTGYEGQHCDTQINHCLSDPCIHGGVCDPLFNDYQCQCPSGWQGKNCEVMVNECTSVNAGSNCLINTPATCHSIFNGYYCQCPANTYGQDCENMPNPCQDYNKCQNNAPCSYANADMSCTCGARYTGDGCEILRDLCGQNTGNNPCQNDGVCSVNAFGYSCSCPAGYGGTNCETDIDECSNVNCPGGGTCYDDIDKYYCRCPLKKTGTNCQRDFDRNYDLYFNHPEGVSYAWIPYNVEVEDATMMALSVWVRYATTGATGVIVQQFIGDRIGSAMKFMELDETGVTVYGINPTMTPINLLYERNAELNDGNWHHVIVNYDFVQGEVSLYLDTVFHDSESHALLEQATLQTFRMWVVLGCDFNTLEQECQGGASSFHGYLSQVNWYKRLLEFHGTPGDISYNFAHPQHIFEETNTADPLQYVILVWNEYELESGVTRIIPSEAKGDRCDKAGRVPACSYFAAASMPTVSNCPGDIVQYSEDRVITASWIEPTFSNLGPNGIVQRPAINRPGSVYAWGRYSVTYTGIDSNGNKAYCHFNLYIQSSRCDLPPIPFGGGQTPSVVVPPTIPMRRSGSTIFCPTTNANQYMVDREHPSLYTCGPSGTWNLEHEFRAFRYPSCGLIRPIPKTSVFIRINYRIDTSACEAVKTNMRARLYEELIRLSGFFTGTLCHQSDCLDIPIEPICSVAKKRRRKRQSTSALTQVTIDVTNADSTTVLDGETISIEEFFRYFILGLDIFNFSDTIANGEIDPLNVDIDVTYICPFGQVLLGDQCVECGPGNYFRYLDASNTTSICDDCPLASYQDLSGQSSCKQCATGLTTEMTGEFLSTACKESCSIGYFYNETASGCSACPIGYYQDEQGQFVCKFCGAGFTTENVGTTSQSQCSASCDSGYQLNGVGNCVACEIGTYRNATETRTCVSCPANFITLYEATKSSSDCDIVACLAGNYRDTTSNTCKPCPLGMYQDEKWMTSCISCGDANQYRTENTGSTNETQCLFYCDSGYEVLVEGSCQICPRHQYKDNTEDIQGLCQTCPNNRRAETAGTTTSQDCTIYRCGVGYEPNVVNTACVECPLGEYQDVAESEECKVCGIGESTRHTASNMSSDCETYCPSGEEKIGNGCVACPKGEYKDNSLGLFHVCTACSPDYTTVGMGSTNIANCTVRTCAPGFKSNADNSGCDSCPLGTYQPQEYQPDCIDCVTGTSTRQIESTSQTQCEPYCPSGQEMIGGVCTECERGYYRDNDIDGKFSMCQLCPVDKITPFTGSLLVSECSMGNCSAGYFLRSSDSLCEACPIGEYQDQKWKLSCTSCGTHKTTENLGADRESLCILECQPGYEDINGNCVQCQRGYYKVENAAAACKTCPVGFTTDIGVIGATSSAQCDIPACVAGTYLDRTDQNNLVCRQCDYDTYADQIWQESCTPCPNNQVTLRLGADTDFLCVANCNSGLQYNFATGQCEFCERGYYRDATDRLQPDCQLCDIQFITGSDGATGADMCTIANCTVPGTYRHVDSNECRQCEIGTYNSVKWEVSCTSCPTGESTKFAGSDSIADCRKSCPRGQYVDASNTCQLCAKGYYREDLTLDECSICPDGLTTVGQGADSVLSCMISPCTSGRYYDRSNLQCIECGIGSYQPDPGTFQCILCPFAIQYTPNTGSTSRDDCLSPCNVGEYFRSSDSSCQACPLGTYNNEAQRFSCIDCPGDQQYTAALGSTSSSACMSYCAAGANPACSEYATCTLTALDSRGYKCECFARYDDVSVSGQKAGAQCTHKCDNGYCQNNAVCTREPALSCSCSEWYEGDRCQTRVDAQTLADDDMDIIIPVAIGVGGLLLLLILILVFCFCWRAANRSSKTKRTSQYNEFQGDRMDKASLHSYNYGQTPYNTGPPTRLMLAPYSELVYDNNAYKAESAVYQA